MRKSQVRYQLFIPKALSDRFEAMARGSGATKSAMLTSALEAWLDRRGASEIETWFGGRLDRISRHLSRLDRNDRIALETLAIFTRYVFTNLIPVPADDKVAMAHGRDRFNRMVQLVGEALAAGRQTIIAESDAGRESSGD